MTQKKSTIDQMIARHQGPTASIIEKAIDMYTAEQEERQAKEIVSELQVIQSIEGSLVETLREIRKNEKAMLETMRKYNAAREQYMKDADYPTFCKTCNEARIYF